MSSLRTSRRQAKRFAKMTRRPALLTEPEGWTLYLPSGESVRYTTLAEMHAGVMAVLETDAACLQ